MIFNKKRVLEVIRWEKWNVAKGKLSDHVGEQCCDASQFSGVCAQLEIKINVKDKLSILEQMKPLCKRV